MVATAAISTINGVASTQCKRVRAKQGALCVSECTQISHDNFRKKYAIQRFDEIKQ
jgi:hypothetical protein